MIDGKTIKKSLKTTSKSLAGAVAKKLYMQLTASANIDLPPTACIFELFKLYNQHDNASIRANFATQRAGHFNRFANFAAISTINQITTTTANRFCDHLAAQQLSSKTITNYRATLFSFCRWLVTRGYLPDNPIAGVPIPKKTPLKIIYMQRPEFDTALQIAANLELWPIFFAAYAGLRQSEIYTLQWQNLDLKRMTMSITGKGGKSAAIPISKKLAAIIAKIKRTTSCKVFPDLTRKKAQYYLRPLQKACPTLAQNGQGWHTFRRTFGSLLVQAGVSIAQVSKLMRHSNITTTERHYAHLVAEHGRDAVELL